ncbi:transcriptional regulator [Calothrix sp. FACHB-1219]|uniref:helix-turn-helix domain-containing protein n=1 Tax=unclassified Calothrix TaxID=2619626 RepID=UPI0016833E4E|nr:MULTISPECIES: transcriptional regulator [unclassified Calothrix]MBD2203895.1 transcriptional regulator [Calothrix sp. FACHB-168]MBD2218320.1 transcriptional regulator [Calothrix sp. FACHB-1219]
MLELRPIRNEADYRAALDEIERLFDAEPNTIECDYLEVLTTLVEAYEQQHYPIAAPEPIEAILYYLESRGLSTHDLEPIIGSVEEVAAILNRQQPLTLEMIRRLNQKLGIPADVLIQPYSLMKNSA